MSLSTKCVLHEPEPGDGIRISVMSRHTLNDGITPDTRIQNFDMHIPLLGPSSKLIGDYYKRGLSWDDFEKRYLEEIRTGAKSEFVLYLAKLSLTHDVTLLCIEENCDHCHRRLLVEECIRRIPQIKSAGNQ